MSECSRCGRKFPIWNLKKINHGKLPKLYTTVYLRVWVIRGGLGENLGWTEVDELVFIPARRVLCAYGWKWQIDKARYIKQFGDFNFELDSMDFESFEWAESPYLFCQECLND